MEYISHSYKVVFRSILAEDISNTAIRRLRRVAETSHAGALMFLNIAHERLKCKNYSENQWDLLEKGLEFPSY